MDFLGWLHAQRAWLTGFAKMPARVCFRVLPHFYVVLDTAIQPTTFGIKHFLSYRGDTRINLNFTVKKNYEDQLVVFRPSSFEFECYALRCLVASPAEDLRKPQIRRENAAFQDFIVCLGDDFKGLFSTCNPFLWKISKGVSCVFFLSEGWYKNHHLVIAGVIKLPIWEGSNNANTWRC